MSKTKDSYYQKHRDEILKQRKDYYEKNKERIKNYNLLYYNANKDKWKDLYKYYDSIKKMNELDKLLKENKILDNEIKNVRKKVWRKQYYLQGMKKRKEMLNRITIEPEATLVVYWND